MYPLAEFDGTMKSIDWAKHAAGSRAAGTATRKRSGSRPEKFVDELAAVLADAPPLPGEEARYAQVLAVLEAAKNDPQLKQAMTQGRRGGRRGAGRAAVPVPQLRPAVAAPLEHDLQRGRLRHRLLHPHRGREVQHPRQLAERDEVLLSGPRRRRRAAQQRQPLHRHLRQGADAAGQRLLVADALQRAPLLRRQPDRPLFARHQEQGR